MKNFRIYPSLFLVLNIYSSVLKINEKNNKIIFLSLSNILKLTDFSKFFQHRLVQSSLNILGSHPYWKYLSILRYPLLGRAVDINLWKNPYILVYMNLWAFDLYGLLSLFHMNFILRSNNNRLVNNKKSYFFY